MPLADYEWTEERVAELKRLWLEARLSFSEIAAQIGCYSRNAVIGKAHRLGLRRDQRPPKERKERPGRKKGPRAITIRSPEVPSAEVFVCKDAGDLEPLHLSLINLRQNSCRWPYGDGPFTFCGHQTVKQPYCAAHAEIASQRSTWREMSVEQKAAMSRGRQRSRFGEMKAAT